MAQYIAVKARTLYALPPTVSFEQGCLVEPFAVGMHAVLRSGLAAGQTAAVIGDGTIGLMTLIAAKSQGAQVCISGRHAWTIDFPLQRCITEQIDVQFSYSSAEEYPVYLQAIAEGRAGLTGLWQSFPLAEGAQVFDRLVHRDESLTKAVLIP